MRITWFAAMTFRIHIAGRIIVTHPEGAPPDVDRAELVAGAQTILAHEDMELPDFEPLHWRPLKRVRLIDAAEGVEGLNLYRLGSRGVVADSSDEGLLVVDDAGALTQFNRWADNAVVVVSGTGAQCGAHGTALLDIARPKLIAMAITDGDLDIAFETLAPLVGGASLLALEPGMALET